MGSVTFKEYYGKQGNCDLIKINENSFDKDNSEEIKNIVLNHLENQQTKYDYFCIDERQIKKLDSSGLVTPLNFIEYQSDQNQKIRILTNKNSPVERLLKMIPLEDKFQIIHSLDEL